MPIAPKDHAEAVAIFRAQVIGGLAARPLEHGELAEELTALSKRGFMPPGADLSRSFGRSTLERWYYDFKNHGLEGLRPGSRVQGHALALTDEQRALVLDIAREYPRARASVIHRTLVAQGRIGRSEVSTATIRRLLAKHGLDDKTKRSRAGDEPRRRWVTTGPGELWHADVCHGPSIKVDGVTTPVRVHAFLDDASRFVVGLRVFSREREVDMLSLLVETLRIHGRPRRLYLDNGATYRGEALSTACARLRINLVHAQPYDPQARGKMERFWGTLRTACLDFVDACTSLHDVQVRLSAFLHHYHAEIHGGLFARCPADVYSEARPKDDLEESDLLEALTIREPRRVRRDGTLSIGGAEWELETEAGFLAGMKVTVARTLYDPDAAPWIEHQDRRHALRRLDAVANGLRRPVARRKARGLDVVPFDPGKALVEQLLKRPRGGSR